VVVRARFVFDGLCDTVTGQNPRGFSRVHEVFFAATHDLVPRRQHGGTLAMLRKKAPTTLGIAGRGASSQQYAAGCRSRTSKACRGGENRPAVYFEGGRRSRERAIVRRTAAHYLFALLRAPVLLGGRQAQEHPSAGCEPGKVGAAVRLGEPCRHVELRRRRTELPGAWFTRRRC